ncbi:homeobox protein vex1-like [Neopsephotus bourkii]|uniref:homeobox protein vex1-like n=1 Tax=Neopsephotus bourkii TaxID=309878 RepID=UPI002AA5C32B|nr:homeobox protein vex1-like [Neopsephotus bourkii]
MKLRRQTQEARLEALFSGLFLPYRHYPDLATSNCSHETDVNISSTSSFPSPSYAKPCLVTFCWQLSLFTRFCQVWHYCCLPAQDYLVTPAIPAMTPMTIKD